MTYQMKSTNTKGNEDDKKVIEDACNESLQFLEQDDITKESIEQQKEKLLSIVQPIVEKHAQEAPNDDVPMDQTGGEATVEEVD